MTAPPEKQLLTYKEVEQIIGLRRAWIYKAVAEGRFPAPVRIGPNSVRWRKSEVYDWLENLSKDQAPSA